MSKSKIQLLFSQTTVEDGLFKQGNPLENNPRISQKQCRNITAVSCSPSISSMKRETTFYDLLSLNSCENVGVEEIKKAYRTMALQYHPDVCPPSRREESKQISVKIRKAYETLSDPILRENYDFELGLIGLSKRRSSESRFSKQVWETQLLELKKRSDSKRKRMVVKFGRD